MTDAGYEVDESGVKLNFANPLEAYQFLNAIFSYKHGEHDKVHDLGNVFLRNREIYKLSLAVEEFLESSDEDGSLSFKLEKASPTFDQILRSLKLSREASAKRTTWPRDKIAYARKWVRCHFAPCILSDELAERVIHELRLLDS